LLTGSAQASDASVRSAIEHSNKQVRESGELKSALKELREDPSSLERLHAAIGKFDGTIRKVISTVSAQKVSTAQGAKGKSEYIGGLRKLMAGFNDVVVAIGDLKAHKATAAKAEMKKAVALVKAGGEEGKRGEALLHVRA
jgi:hypothetical protein